MNGHDSTDHLVQVDIHEPHPGASAAAFIQIDDGNDRVATAPPLEQLSINDLRKLARRVGVNSQSLKKDQLCMAIRDKLN